MMSGSWFVQSNMFWAISILSASVALSAPQGWISLTLVACKSLTLKCSVSSCAFCHFVQNFPDFYPTVFHNCSPDFLNRLGLWMACLKVHCSPLRCGHAWNSCTTLWSESWPWHHRQRPQVSYGWFELEYHQAFNIIWCNIFARCFRCEWKSAELILHVCTLGIMADNWRDLPIR